MDSATWQECVTAGVDVLCLAISLPLGAIGAVVVFVRAVNRGFTGK